MKFQDHISFRNIIVCLVHSKWPNSVKFDVQAYYVGTEENMALKLIFYMSTCQNTCVLKIS